MSEDKFDKDECPDALSYSLNAQYRLFRKITMEDGGEDIEFYGPYLDYYKKFHGQNDLNSWDKVIKNWDPSARLFAKLPIHEEDLARVVPGKNPYIVVTYYGIEKIDKPFGYGTSDYWHSYRFRNVSKEEAAKLIEKLAEKNCPENRYNVGLELRVRDEELAKIVNQKRRAIRQRVFSILKVEKTKEKK